MTNKQNATAAYAIGYTETNAAARPADNEAIRNLTAPYAAFTAASAKARASIYRAYILGRRAALANTSAA